MSVDRSLRPSATPHETRIAALPCGWRTAYWDFGDPAGQPVLGFHGTPICGLCFAPMHVTAAELGVRLIAPDRPGVGQSSRHGRYAVSDWPAVVEKFADALGIDRFGVIGWSSGGPYALACAAAIEERLDGVVVIAGMAPIAGREDLRHYAEVDRRLLGLARRAPLLARLQVARMVRKAHANPEAAIAAFTDGLSADDRALIESLGPSDEAFAFFPASVNGSSGLADDYIALASDWGFKLEEVTRDVRLFAGSADPTVPLAVAQAMSARLQGSTLLALPDEGHLLIYTHQREVLDAAAGRSQ